MVTTRDDFECEGQALGCKPQIGFYGGQPSKSGGENEKIPNSCRRCKMRIVGKWL